MAVNRAVQPTKGQGEPLESYVLTTIPKPRASPKHVVVRVVLRPVNPTDLIVSRWGSWANLDLKTVVVGSEGVGVIDEVGEGVSTVKVGQRVIPFVWGRVYALGYGTWRDYIEVPECDAFPVPDNIPDGVAAQFFINPWTAYGLLKDLQIPKGEYLVQSAAGSSLGRQLITLAKHYGIKTINVVRRDEYIKQLTDIGADYVINSSKEDVPAKVLEITKGKGAYAALDAVATEMTETLAGSVRDGGHVLGYGLLSGTYVRVGIKDLLRKVTVAFFAISPYNEDTEERKELVKTIWELLSSKAIVPTIGKTYPLEDFKEALVDTERGGRDAKVFLSSY